MLYLLSQLAFLNEANSHIILSTHGVVPKLVDAGELRPPFWAEMIRFLT